MYNTLGTLNCILLIACYFCVYTQEPRPFLNTYVPAGVAPFIVFVKSVLNNNITKCTGSILDKNWVLTVASCIPSFDNKSKITVSANLNSYDIANEDAQNRLIVEVIPHPSFKPEKLGEGDLALLQVQRPFTINDFVQPMVLEDSGWPVEDGRPTKRTCSVIGYGDISHSQYDYRLKTRNVRATHSDSCSCTRRNQWMELVCLDPMEDVGLCSADLGAPLICDDKVVAMNHMLIIKQNCTQPDNPDSICGDYSSVSYFIFLCPYLGWIKATVVTAPDQPHFCNTAPAAGLSGSVFIAGFVLRYFQ